MNIKTEPAHFFVETNDVNLSCYEWGKPGNPVILMVHATGMHARVWEKTISYLSDDFHVFALDIRGHGQSQYDGYLQDWTLMGKDVLAVIRHRDLTDIIGVGHSMGGHALLQSVLQEEQRFKRLVLIDPVIFTPERYDHVSEFEKGSPKDNPLSRRRSEFENWQTMAKLFKARPPYSTWNPEVVDDYCKFGVIPQTGGSAGVKLACAPDIEASVYMGHCSVNLTQRLSNITLPVTILRAHEAVALHGDKIDFSASPTWPNLADAFANGTDVYLSQLNHFIPMEDPELVAKYVRKTAD